jgi:hypothetical protein
MKKVALVRFAAMTEAEIAAYMEEMSDWLELDVEWIEDD